MSNEFICYRFQKDYPDLNNKLLKSSKELFDLGVVVACSSELEKGFIVKKQLKTTSKGTKFNFEPATSEQELGDYIKDLKQKLKNIDVKSLEDKISQSVERICG